MGKKITDLRSDEVLMVVRYDASKPSHMRFDQNDMQRESAELLLTLSLPQVTRITREQRVDNPVNGLEEQLFALYLGERGRILCDLRALHIFETQMPQSIVYTHTYIDTDEIYTDDCERAWTYLEQNAEAMGITDYRLSFGSRLIERDSAPTQVYEHTLQFNAAGGARLAMLNKLAGIVSGISFEYHS